jgi:hypothetical protein
VRCSASFVDGSGRAVPGGETREAESLAALEVQIAINRRGGYGLHADRAAECADTSRATGTGA